MEEPQRAHHRHPRPLSSPSCSPLQHPLQPPHAPVPAQHWKRGMERRSSPLPAKGAAATRRGGRG
uniref:Uncharacterized protein n=1 Tax=Oryza barthii TaxID=65489 RepID=A0A0D3FTD8_9ORYZ